MQGKARRKVKGFPENEGEGKSQDDGCAQSAENRQKSLEGEGRQNNEQRTKLTAGTICRTVLELLGVETQLTKTKQNTKANEKTETINLNSKENRILNKGNIIILAQQ